MSWNVQLRDEYLWMDYTYSTEHLGMRWRELNCMMHAWKLINLMKHGPKMEANNFLGIQQVPRVLWNKFHYGTPITWCVFLFRARLIQYMPCHTFLGRCILILHSRLRLDLLCGLPHSDFSTKIMWAFPLSLVHVTCSVLLIALVLIIK